MNKKNKDIKLPVFLYLETIKATGFIINNRKLYKQNDFDIIFEISSILLITILVGSKNKYDKNWTEIRESLLDLFIKDIDHSLRLIGVSDIKIGKLVKKYVKKFYFRIPKIEKIIICKDLNLFIDYLKKFNIIDSTNDLSHIKYFFNKIMIMKKRSQLIKNKKLIYKDLFK